MRARVEKVEVLSWNKSLKYDPYRVRLTVGGNRLIYTGDPIDPDAPLLESNIIFNIKISTLGVHFILRSHKYFF